MEFNTILSIIIIIVIVIIIVVFSVLLGVFNKTNTSQDETITANKKLIEENKEAIEAVKKLAEENHHIRPISTGSDELEMRSIAFDPYQCAYATFSGVEPYQSHHY